MWLGYMICLSMMLHYEVKEINRIMKECITDWIQIDNKTHRFKSYGTQKYWFRKEADDDGFVECDRDDLAFE